MDGNSYLTGLSPKIKHGLPSGLISLHVLPAQKEQDDYATTARFKPRGQEEGRLATLSDQCVCSPGQRAGYSNSTVGVQTPYSQQRAYVPVDDRSISPA